MTAKEVVRQLLDLMPEGCSYEDIRKQIELFELVRRQQEAMMLGEAASLEIYSHPKQ